jgi:hypothetical protein
MNPMVRIGVSACNLREHLREADRHAEREGRHLSEGARRVLAKLVQTRRLSGLHRTYERSGQQVSMSDLISDGDLARGGYIPVDTDSMPIGDGDPVKHDRVTLWISESEGGRELWIGERLKV